MGKRERQEKKFLSKFHRQESGINIRNPEPVKKSSCTLHKKAHLYSNITCLFPRINLYISSISISVYKTHLALECIPFTKSSTGR